MRTEFLFRAVFSCCEQKSIVDWQIEHRSPTILMKRDESSIVRSMYDVESSVRFKNEYAGSFIRYHNISQPQLKIFRLQVIFDISTLKIVCLLNHV